MSKKIRVVICPQDIRKEPYIKEIDDDLKTLQNLVGGYVEEITLYGIEDGRLKHKPVNGSICGYVLVGDIIIARRADQNLVSVPNVFLVRLKENYWTDMRNGKPE